MGGHLPAAREPVRVTCLAIVAAIFYYRAMTRLPLWRWIAAGLVALLGAGCASQPTTQNTPPTYYTGVQLYGVQGVTLKRIQKGRTLRYVDLVYLLQRRVPSNHILDYVRATHAPYSLTPSQIDTLAQLGASNALLSYLEHSTAYLAHSKIDFNHPYFYMENYWGPAPFPFQMPGWSWVIY